MEALRSVRRTQTWMDTAVTVEVVANAASPSAPSTSAAFTSGDAAAPTAPPSLVATDCEDAVARAFAWFRHVEAACSRFEPESELCRLTRCPGVAVQASPLLFQAVRLAVQVAAVSGGAFDPAVGSRMEARGFDRNYRTGGRQRSGIRPDAAGCWRDVELDEHAQTITLRRPLLLDLGGLAKGLAIDLALRELAGFPGGAVEAGGDLAVRGVSVRGGPWRIGVRHPRRSDALYTWLDVGDGAVCTSGDYERRAPCGADGGGHHLDGRTGRVASEVASCTVVAPNAVLADALGTAATVLGPRRGLAWLRRQGVEALLLTPTLEPFATAGFRRLARCL